ncbi:DNA-binding response regulator [Terasakiella sp. SH-1]|uniref:DNA-binding response regulator n=1 Tax=Terasakiella sp. SH-1 TaxID=2560057 RepID=UPI0010743386|nr:DNA-binding response regulator [Terasakiella sp. SH-1]
MAHDKTELELQVESEFLEEARDIMNSLEIQRENLRSNYNDDDMGKLLRGVKNLGAQALTADFAIVSLLAHRLEHYLERIPNMDAPHGDNVRLYLDKIESALDGTLQVEATQTSANLVRELPAVTKFDHEFGDLEKKNIEILIIVPDKATAHIVEREMAECGYRVSFAKSSFNGIELAIRTRPDMVLASGQIDQLSGIDLANAFASMPAAQNIPFALLTSNDWGHPSLRALPHTCGLVRKGKSFGDDIAECLKRFGIT